MACHKIRGCEGEASKGKNTESGAIPTNNRKILKYKKPVCNNNFKQGSKYVLDYFTEMYYLWKELNSKKHIPNYTCPHPCRYQVWAFLLAIFNLYTLTMYRFFTLSTNHKCMIIKCFTSIIIILKVKHINDCDLGFFLSKTNFNIVAFLELNFNLKLLVKQKKISYHHIQVFLGF